MDSKGNKIGLALSGGGYRAAAYHIGTLRALHNLGVLDKVDVISSVSGGSITAAYYALNKDNYDLFESNLIQQLQDGVMLWPIINIATVLLLSIGIEVAVIWLLGWWGVLSFLVLTIVLFLLWYKIMPISCIIEWKYRHKFFADNTLGDLPENPLISINATDMATSNQFYFSKNYVGGYRYKYDSFNASSVAIAKAVMASSCVPFAFSPIRIPSKYFTSTFNHKEKPLLFDGGLYDNQGTHCLTDPSSKSQCDIIIATVAGNTKISNKLTLNPFLALWKTSNVLMNRIKNIQVQENLYKRIYPNKRFAYVDLSWDCTERLLTGFIDNLKCNRIYPEVIEYHTITDKQIEALKNSDTEMEARAEILLQLKDSVHWEELKEICPSAKEHKIAFNVCTNLIGLSSSKLNNLIKHSQWMTEIQVRLYLPMLLK